MGRFPLANKTPPRPNLQLPHMHIYHNISSHGAHTNTVDVTEIACGLPTEEKSNKELHRESSGKLKLPPQSSVCCRSPLSKDNTHCAKRDQLTCFLLTTLDSKDLSKFTTGSNQPRDTRRTALKACPTLSGCSYRQRPISQRQKPAPAAALVWNTHRKTKLAPLKWIYSYSQVQF